MVIVTHEIGFAEKVASRLIFIDKGRIAEDGDPQVLIKNPPSQRLQEFCSTSLNFSASLSPKGRHTRFLSFKIASPASILIFCSVFSLEESCGGSCSSSSACWAHLPTRYPYPALQPQRQRTQRLNRPRNRISNKKAAYGALADVLDNDTSRKELIDQLRTVAATPLRNRYRRSCRRRWLKSKPCCKRSPKSAAIMVKPFPPASGNFIAISPAPRISRLIHKPSAMR